jgi:hypothetical protein
METAIFQRLRNLHYKGSFSLDLILRVQMHE